MQEGGSFKNLPHGKQSIEKAYVFSISNDLTG